MKNKPTKFSLLTKRNNKFETQYPSFNIPIVINAFSLKVIPDNSDYQLIKFNKDFLKDTIKYSFSIN